MAPFQEPGEPPSGVTFSLAGDRSALTERIEDPTFLDRLAPLLSDEEQDPSEVMSALLHLGTERFGVEHGVLARVDPAAATHTVAVACGSHPDLQPGTSTDLSATHDRHVIGQNGALELRHAAEDEAPPDPAPDAFGLSTYFGAKVVVDETLYGTIAFVDRAPRAASFDEADAAALGLLVRGVRRVLKRRRPMRRPAPSRPQLVSVFDGSPNMIVLHDEAGNLFFPNARFCEETGYRESDLAAMKVWDLDPDVTPDRAQDTWKDMAPGDRIRWEGRYRRKDGSTFPVEVDLQRLDDPEADRFVTTARDVTERREAEEQLRATKRLLEKTFESLGEAVLVIDPRKRQIVTCNSAVETVFGYEPDELIGQSTERLHKSPEAYDRFGTISESALDEDGIFRHDYRMRRKDGEIIETEHVVTPLKGDDWRQGVVSVVRDVTERRRAEEELRHQREQLSMAVEGSNIGTWNWDFDTDQVVFNRQWAEMLGYTREELPFAFSTWEDLVHPDDLDRALDDLRDYLEGAADTFNPHIRMRTKSGKWKWIQTIGKVLEYDEAGTPTRAAGIHLDIHERKQARQALQEERDRFATLFHNLPTPVVHGRPNDEGRFQVGSVNETFETVFGYPEDDIRGETLHSLIVPSEEQEEAAALRSELLTGRPVSREVRRQTVDGVRDFRLQVALRQGADGPTEGYAIYTDVTERKERERTLARRKALLEAQAEATIDGLLVVDEDRTVAFHNDRFREIWQLPPDVLPPTADASPSEQEVFDAVTGLLHHPESFWDTVKHLYEHPDEESRDLIRLTDGRWLDRYSAPIVSGEGTYFGRLWAFRDVTDRRRMQKRLLEVQEAERRRIDQEIHDEMGGLLTSLQFTLGTARQHFPDDSASTEHVEQIEDLVSDLATITRTISRKLYPHELSDYGLAGSLSSLADEMSEQHDLTVDLRCGVEPGERFSSLLERTAYWIVQEALLNTVRHAETEAAQVTVQSHDDHLRLRIADEGVGFDPSAPHGTKSFGLEGIRRRVERLDGTFELDAHPGEGTRIVVTLPLTMTSGPA